MAKATKRVKKLLSEPLKEGVTLADAISAVFKHGGAPAKKKARRPKKPKAS